MGYELYLRRRDPEASLPDPSALASSLKDAGAMGAEGALSFACGGARVGAKLAWHDGTLQGVDLDVPFGAPEADFRAAVLLGARLGAKHSLALNDPQLGGELTPERAEDAVAAWRTANSYAVNTAGVIEDARSASVWTPPPQGLKPRTKLMLYALGGLAVAYLIFGWLLEFLLKAPLPPID